MSDHRHEKVPDDKQQLRPANITWPRARRLFHGYRGTLLVIISIVASVGYGLACSEFFSVTAYTNECHINDRKETWKVQINTRLAVSPIGQHSCFKITNRRKQTLGKMEFKTTSHQITCRKQLLWYVPKSTAKCQSYSMLQFIFIVGLSWRKMRKYVRKQDDRFHDGNKRHSWLVILFSSTISYLSLPANLRLSLGSGFTGQPDPDDLWGI